MPMIRSLGVGFVCAGGYGFELGWVWVIGYGDVWDRKRGAAPAAALVDEGVVVEDLLELRLCALCRVVMWRGFGGKTD